MMQNLITGASLGIVKNLAEFLPAEKSSWITGQVFHMDSAISTIKI